MSKHGKHLLITPNWQNSALSYDLKIQKMGHHLFFNIHLQILLIIHLKILHQN